MGEERLALSQKERDRLKELHTVLAGQLKVGAAAKRLSVSPRQVRRMSAEGQRAGRPGRDPRPPGTCVKPTASGEAGSDRR